MHSNKYFFPYQSFVFLPTDALNRCVNYNIKIYIKTGPTCFGAVTPSSVLKHVRAVLM